MNTKRKIILSFILCIIACLMLNTTVYADTLPCKSATATGHYRHPVSGAIEDSGGEASEALGQSMVTNVVSNTALVEEKEDGSYYVSLRFNLMNNLSDIKLSIQSCNDSSWQSVSYDKTASGDDTGDLRLTMPGTDNIIRAECKVEAMGRYVIFYITLDNFTEGNAGGFVQTETNTEDETNDNKSSNNNEETNATNNTIDNDINIEETPAAKSQTSNNSTDILDNVEGLTIGGDQQPNPNTITKEINSDNSSQTNTGNAIVKTDTSPQNLNIDSNVWTMFFVLLICGNIISGIILIALFFFGKYLYSRYIDSKLPTKEVSEANDAKLSENNEILLEDMDTDQLLEAFGDSWEAHTDESI